MLPFSVYVIFTNQFIVYNKQALPICNVMKKAKKKKKSRAQILHCIKSVGQGRKYACLSDHSTPLQANIYLFLFHSENVI